MCKKIKTKYLTTIVLFGYLLIVSTICNGCMAGAMFKHIVIDPDEPGPEFKDYQAEEYFTYPRQLRGEYLGIKIINNKNFHHYQYDGILNGEGRTIHVYISADGYGEAFAYEDDKVILSDAMPAYLIFNLHASHPYNFAYMWESIPLSSGDKKYPQILCGITIEDHKKILIFKPEDFCKTGIENKIWEGKLSVDRKTRSKVMLWIRPLYGLPVAVLCIPVDLVMFWVYTPFELVLFSPRIEAMTYVGMVESLK